MGARARRLRNAETAAAVKAGEMSAGAILVHHAGASGPR